MGSLLYIRRGGLAGVPYTQLIDLAPSFQQPGTPLIRMGMRYGQGEASNGTFVVLDSSAVIPTSDYLTLALGGRQLIKWTENAAGCEYWLAVARLLTTEEGRGEAKAYRAAQWNVTTEDANVDLRGQAFTEAWVRPQETDYARLVALQQYCLNDVSSTAPYRRVSTTITVHDSHLCKNANTVTMPATTYPIGTQPQDVIDDCGTTAGKDYGVVIHHGGALGGGDAGGSHTNNTFAASDGNTATTLKLTMTQAAGATQSVLALITANGTGTVTGVADTKGNTWAKVIDKTQSSASGNVEIWRTDIGTPLTTSDVVTATFNTSSVDARCMRLYIVNSLGTLVTTATNDGSGTAISLSVPSASVGQFVVVGIGLGRTGPTGATDELSATDAAYTVIPTVIEHGRGDAFGSTQLGGGWRNDLSGTDTYDATITQARGWAVACAIFSAGSAPTSIPSAGSGGLGSDIGNCSHLCLQYLVPTDLTTNPCTLKISDNRSEVDEDTVTPPTTYAPRWLQGMATNHDAQRLLSGIVSTYQTPSGAGSVFAQSNTRVRLNDYWVDPVTDSYSQTPAQAQVRASAVLQTFLNEHQTHRVSIPLGADQTYKLAAGMAIQIKSAAMLGGPLLGTFVTRRVAQLTWEPRNDGTYWAHMELDRPERLVPGSASLGAAAGDPTRATIASGTYAGQTVQQALDSLSAANPLTTLGDMLYRGAGGSNTRLAIGASNTHLTSDGTKPLWSPQTALTDPMTTIGDIIVRNVSNVTARLGIGASNTVLTALGTGAAPVWATVAAGGTTSPLTTKGDVYGYSSTNARIPIGTDAQILTADSTQTLGLKWATLPAGAGTRVYNSGAFSVAASAETAVTFDSERSDSDAFHSTSSNTSRLTVPTGKGGRYAIAGTVEWAASALGTLRRLSIRLNGTTYIAKDEITSIINAALPQSVETVYDLVAADYVELVAFQDTVGAVNLNAAGNYSPEFGMVLEGSAGAGGARTEATLSGDVTMVTADTFYDGPTTTPVAGIYDVWGRIVVQAVATAQQYVVGRLIANGSATPIDEVETQTAMVNTGQAIVYLSARVTADGTNPILLRATASNANLVMKRDPRDDSSALHRATLLVLTRVS